MGKTKAQIYVINLKRSEDRRQNIDKQFDAMGIEYEIFPAVDGTKGYHPLFDHYNEEKRMRIKGKILRKSQLGCFASHYQLWQKCIVDNRPVIAIEDDAKFIKHSFMAFYNATDRLDDRYECIRLFKSNKKNNTYVKVENIGNMEIAKFSKGHMRTMGYYLTPSGAEKFLKHAQQWFLPVDITIDRFWVNKVECYGVVTPCLDSDPMFDSTVGVKSDKNKEKRTIWVKIRREIFSTGEFVQRRAWNLSFAIKSLFRRH